MTSLNDGAFGFAEVIDALNSMGALLDENASAFQRMGEEIDRFIAEELVTLHPSERLVYWFLVRVCRRYPLDTLSLLEALREQSPPEVP
jgi:hypothetical protein